MKRDWLFILFVFASLAAIAWGTVGLERFLERSSGGIDEIEVYFAPRPNPLIYAYVRGRCGEPRIGRLDEYLRCRDQVYLELWG